MITKKICPHFHHLKSFIPGQKLDSIRNNHRKTAIRHFSLFHRNLHHHKPPRLQTSRESPLPPQALRPAAAAAAVAAHPDNFIRARVKPRAYTAGRQAEPRAHKPLSRRKDSGALASLSRLSKHKQLIPPRRSLQRPRPQ